MEFERLNGVREIVPATARSGGHEHDSASPGSEFCRGLNNYQYHFDVLILQSYWENGARILAIIHAPTVPVPNVPSLPKHDGLPVGSAYL